MKNRCMLPAGFFLLAVLPAWGGTEGLRGVVLTTDRTVDMTSNEAIIRSVCKEGMTPQQKCIALWRTIVLRGIHKGNPPFEDRGNIAELMTKYGQALCGTYAYNFAQLVAGTGMPAARVGLKGHWVTAVKYWGGWHTYDVDMWNYYAKADGVVAAPGEIRRLKDKDGRYVLRYGPPVRSYPWYIGSETLKGLFSLYAVTSIGNPYPRERKWKWKYGLTLRPGQEIILSWYPDPDVGFVCVTHVPRVRSPRKHRTLREYLEDDYDYYRRKAGKKKWHWGYRRGGLRSNARQSWNGVGGNGRVVFDLLREGGKYALAMAASHENLAVRDGRLVLTDPGKGGWFVLDFDTPYVYGDGWVEKPVPPGVEKIEVFDGRAWRTVYPRGGVDDGKRIRLFDVMRGKSHVKMKVSLKPGAEPVKRFTAVGVFHLNYKCLPGLVKGKNTVRIRLSDPEALASFPLYVTYVYDMVDEKGKILRHEKVLAFTRDRREVTVDMGMRHWPLNRGIRLVCGGAPPREHPPVEETGELDWGGVPWTWTYWRVNFWNDFERGDRVGWKGRLCTENPYRGDFCLDNSLMSPDGSRQLKFIWFGAWLNRDTRFRCMVYVKNVGKIVAYVRAQKDGSYPQVEIGNLKDGEWQPLEFRVNDCSLKGKNHPRNGDFMTNIYLLAEPAPGKAKKDVVFKIDDTVCWDGELPCDPFAGPEAFEEALGKDPAWNAHPQ